MKLIIDIPDDVYEDIEHGKGDFINSLNWAVRNGTPISTEGDLISRSELKKALQEYKQTQYNDDRPDLEYEYIDINDLNYVIDNAPTVEPCYQTTSCLDCGNYDKENHNCPRYCEVIKEAINSRPHGEWVRLSSRLYKCKNCGFISDYKYPFCHCGADMRKGGAE